MRVVEAVYFIFFLPLSAIENTELSNLILTTSYTSLFALLNIFYFMFFFMLKNKCQKWQQDIRLKGYWVEVPLVKNE
jgi:hypothetical protein